jgi:hypothetical protein
VSLFFLYLAAYLIMTARLILAKGRDEVIKSPIFQLVEIDLD